jgi:hypothetical protein
VRVAWVALARELLERLLAARAGDDARAAERPSGVTFARAGSRPMRVGRVGVKLLHPR